MPIKSMKSKRMSPWGQVDQSERLLPGLTMVFTPGHGGLMLTEKFAQKHLSAGAIAYADVWGSGASKRLCYEEDCAYAIVFWELIEKFGEALYGAGTDIEERRQSLLQTLSDYYPKYLRARGVEPCAPLNEH